MIDNNEYILEVSGIKKHFGGVYALDDVDLQLKHDEILGIVGDNGAGKSTLIKIISGALKRDEGEIYCEGKKVKIDNPKDAHSLGIETVYQNLSLVDLQNPSVNVFLGREVCYGGILTAALGVNESKKALELIKLLKESSHISVIVISHNMQHIFSIVDRIMVLRRGKLITVQDVHDVTATDIIKYITGAEEVIERV